MLFFSVLSLKKNFVDLVKIRDFVQWKKGWVFCLTIEDVVFISLHQCRDAISQSKQTLVAFWHLWPVLP